VGTDLLTLATPALVEGLRRRTHESAAAWAARWGLSHIGMTVSAQAWAENGRPATTGDGDWHDAGATATLFWPSALQPMVQDALFPCGPHELRGAETTLAGQATHQAAADLRHALIAAWSIDAPLTAGVAEWSLSVWRAPVQVSIDLDESCRIMACIAAAPLQETLSSRARPALGAIDARAFGPLPAQAELIVGRADIALPDAAALQVGDVIVLDTRIDEPLELRVQQGAISLRANLGRVGDRRAAQLVSPAKA